MAMWWDRQQSPNLILWPRMELGSYSFVGTYEAAFSRYKSYHLKKECSIKARYPATTSSPTLRSLLYLRSRMEERDPHDKSFFSGLFHSSLRFCRRCGKAFVAAVPIVPTQLVEKGPGVYWNKFLFEDIMLANKKFDRYVFQDIAI